MRALIFSVSLTMMLIYFASLSACAYKNSTALNYAGARHTFVIEKLNARIDSVFCTIDTTRSIKK
jgi:hypothetical protein